MKKTPLTERPLDLCVRIMCGINLIIMIALIFAALVLSGRAYACVSDVAKATTDVYVRDDDGRIVGSLYSGDRVLVMGKDGGWQRVSIGGKEYNVWGEYLEQTGERADDVEIAHSLRKSKSGGTPDKNGVMKKKEHRIDSHSPFADW